MATSLDNLRSERPARPENIAAEFAEIKRLLREIDDFVSNLKILEETLAQHADADKDSNIDAASYGCDSGESQISANPSDALERKKRLMI
jgi:hypothetical protein